MIDTTSWRSGIEAIGIGAMMAAVAHGSRTNADFHLTALLYAAVAVGGGVLVLAARMVLALLKRRRPYLGLNNPASPQQLRDFHRIVERVREMPEYRRAELDALVERTSTASSEEAREVARQAALRSGRVSPHDYKRPGRSWGLLEEVYELCDGAYGVALAVLVDDLISDADYSLLVVPWIAAGEQIYAPAEQAAITLTALSS
ncbi:hypothetical protein OHQ88_34155 (plasmid) [Micromonospora zamorensis]|uniref:hypothetical protein n=1 Tax=Micromonospora zamorensis TaxID=709883 RepID=UPI002E201613